MFHALSRKETFEKRVLGDRNLQLLYFQGQNRLA
jgi:hypothetical protein